MPVVTLFSGGLRDRVGWSTKNEDGFGGELMGASSMFGRRGGSSAATATVFGTLAGIGGMTHGIGEVLQGDSPVDALWLESWATGPIARNMGGEPGLTILPTTLWAGVATLVFSAAVIGWSLARSGRRRAGMVLILLSIGMLLSGGGVGPPVIGILAGLVAHSGIDRDRPFWIGSPSARTMRRWARALPPLFGVAVANATFLVLGSLLLIYTIDFNQPTLFEWSFYVTVLMLLALLPAAPAYDIQQLGTAVSNSASSAWKDHVGAR